MTETVRDDVTTATPPAPPKLRADAARNRARLIEAARAVFLAASPDAEVSLEQVAREAGVGIGTLYRHFPTRLDLLEAVYREEVDGLQQAADLSLGVIQKTFEHEGLEFAAFLEGAVQEPTVDTIADHVDQCLEEAGVAVGQRPVLKEAILATLQGAFYDSEEAERLFFSRLSATYTLLFCLNTEPRIVEYFQNMAADFYLYVGSDLIVHVVTAGGEFDPDPLSSTHEQFLLIRKVESRGEVDVNMKALP